LPGPILPISQPILPAAIRPAGEPASSGAFRQAFQTAIESVQSAQQTAATSVEQFLSGEGSELHSAILATQRAELSFDLLLQARNKVVSAYQEIMRMPM
jgi:flagellar hook-basal body complex protein FliE